MRRTTLVRTKTGRQRNVPIPQSIVKALPRTHKRVSVSLSFATDRAMPGTAATLSLGLRQGVPRARTRRLASRPSAFTTCARRSHDPNDARGAGPDRRKVTATTGHRSRELKRYQHLTPEVRALTVNLILIAAELFRGKRARKERESGTPTGTVRGRHVTEKLEGAPTCWNYARCWACQP